MILARTENQDPRTGTSLLNAAVCDQRRVPSEERLGPLGRAVLADSVLRAELIGELEREVAASPFHSLALVQLGSLALATSDPRAARARLTEALAVDPEASRVHDRLGWIALETGDARSALREFETERRLHPLPPRLDLGEGKAWQALGDMRRARQAYQRALVANPSSLEARDSLASVGFSD